MAEYTPGPWAYEHEAGDEWWFGGKGCSQIVIRPANSPNSSFAVLGCADDEREKVIATARVIAAAPELVEALKLWLAYDNLDEADFSEVGPMLLYADAIAATRAAIAKATDGEG